MATSVHGDLYALLQRVYGAYNGPYTDVKRLVPGKYVEISRTAFFPTAVSSGLNRWCVGLCSIGCINHTIELVASPAACSPRLTTADNYSYIFSWYQYL